MDEIWKSQSPEIYKAWIWAISDEASDKLTEWEYMFVADIILHLEFGRQLTEKQATILERIYAEKTK